MDQMTGIVSADDFVDLIGRQSWQARIDAIVQAQPLPGKASHCARDALRRHAIEIAIERQRRPARRPTPVGEARIGRLAAEAVRLHRQLPQAARRRFELRLEQAMLDGQSLTPLFHLLRTAWLHRSRGFEVCFAGLLDEAPCDLLISRDAVEAEVICSVVSAESGRDLHRGAWFKLADSIDPDLQTWLAAHPGRYLLKMTLPNGLRLAGDRSGAGDDLAALHRRIKQLLAEKRRSDHDDAAVIRLDPLFLAGAQSGGGRARAPPPARPGPRPPLRSEFGPDTHLAVTVAGNGVFAMAAHAGRASDVPAAVRRHMAALAPARLSGPRPGILAIFVDDTELTEWRRLAADMSLEAEARQFLTTPEARNVVSVACTSRHELFDEGCEDAEFRFRNPTHKACKLEALAPSIVSST